MERAGKRAGVERWTPYALRHAAATDIAEQADRAAAQALLGHASSVVTQRYVHEDAVAKAASRRRHVAGQGQANARPLP